MTGQEEAIHALREYTGTSRMLSASLSRVGMEGPTLVPRYLVAAGYMASMGFAVSCSLGVLVGNLYYGDPRALLGGVALGSLCIYLLACAVIAGAHLAVLLLWIRTVNKATHLLIPLEKGVSDGQ